MKKWNTISGDFRMKDVSRGMIDSRRGEEARGKRTTWQIPKQSFHLGLGFIVDPGTTKLARTWRKQRRVQLVLLFSLSSLRPIAFPFCGLKYFHEEEEEKEEEISLFTGKIESPWEEIILTRDYVPRTRILTLNKFPPSRNSIVYFSPFEGNRLENEKSEICRAYCGRRTDSFETIYKNYRFDRWKEYY